MKWRKERRKIEEVERGRKEDRRSGKRKEGE